MLKHLLAGASALVLVAMAPAHAATSAAVNPLTAPWTGPYGGLPPFDKVKVSDFPSALDAAIAEARTETEAIANNPAPATFENTIVAMERTGETLNRVMSIYGVFSGNLNTPDFQKVDQEYSPKISVFADYVAHNAKLFQRVAAVRDGAEMAWSRSTTSTSSRTAPSSRRRTRPRPARSTNGWPPSTQPFPRTNSMTKSMTC